MRLTPFVALVAALTAVPALASTDTVTRVIDGDTIVVGTERIRLRGIDTPELRSYRCWAELKRALRARDALQELVSGRAVTIERFGTDRFGRTLAVVRLPDATDVGSILIARGHALPWHPSRDSWAARKRAWCEE